MWHHYYNELMTFNIYFPNIYTKMYILICFDQLQQSWYFWAIFIAYYPFTISTPRNISFYEDIYICWTLWKRIGKQHVMMYTNKQKTETMDSDGDFSRFYRNILVREFKTEAILANLLTKKNISQWKVLYDGSFWEQNISSLKKWLGWSTWRRELLLD